MESLILPYNLSNSLSLKTITCSFVSPNCGSFDKSTLFRTQGITSFCLFIASFISSGMYLLLNTASVISAITISELLISFLILSDQSIPPSIFKVSKKTS